jgi:hypothetical protein
MNAFPMSIKCMACAMDVGRQLRAGMRFDKRSQQCNQLPPTAFFSELDLLVNAIEDIRLGDDLIP